MTMRAYTKKANRERKVLAEVQSRSNPDKVYAILLGDDNVIYCECVGWKMRKTCAHLTAYHKGELNG
jgi:hypothetical protein